MGAGAIVCGRRSGILGRVRRKGGTSTRWTGAADPAWIDPVASGAFLPENGFSLKRDDSPLQAATPKVVRTNAAARGNGKRNHSAIQAIATHTHTQYKAPS